MTQPAIIPSVDTPEKFIRMLVGLWLFFTLSLGTASSWIFTNLNPDIRPDMWWDGFIFAGIYSFIFLLFFGLTWKPLMKKFPLDRPNVLMIHGFIQVVISIAGFGLGFVITGALHSFMYQGASMDTTKSEIGLTIIALFCLIGILMTNGFFYSTAYMRRSMDAEKRLIDSELSALRAQINPHFLFNSLNSIAALVKISPDKAEAVTEDLADVFRYTLRASEHPLVTLKEELEISELYLNIEKARFEERLTVIKNVPENLLSIPFPVLTLQPLLENAIKHGVSKKEGSHTVTIEVRLKDNMVEIEVSDTGPGFPHHDFNKILTMGTGLSNVFQRLRLHFGDLVDGAVSNQSLMIRFPVQTN